MQVWESLQNEMKFKGLVLRLNLRRELVVIYT